MKRDSKGTTKVRISEFKAHLSEYVRRAGAGETILICDRDRPVAELTPAAGALKGLRLRPPTRNADLRNIQGVKPKREVDWVAVLREERDRR